MIINDFQGKLQELEDKNFSYAVNNNYKVDSNENNIQNLQSGMSKVNELINESIGRIKILEDFKSNLEANLNNIINEIKEKQNANDTTIKKVEKIEQVLQNNNIKIEDIKIENKKEFKDIEIKNYEKNSNEKELKFKIFHTMCRQGWQPVDCHKRWFASVQSQNEHLLYLHTRERQTDDQQHYRPFLRQR